MSACTPEDGEEDTFDYDPHRPGNKERRARQEYAKSICQSCPVIHICLLSALDEEEGASAQNRYEIRGGLGPVERAALDPKAGKRTPARPKDTGVRVTQPRHNREAS